LFLEVDPILYPSCRFLIEPTFRLYSLKLFIDILIFFGGIYKPFEESCVWDYSGLIVLTLAITEIPALTLSPVFTNTVDVGGK
ncbi:MAG: hypothetical protein PHS86_11560, partial [Syntrophaceae bacterium]|nr:hypothetical protein [Syntrophaceae bacterium]